MIINLTKENFQKEVLESQIPVIVDFWAPWCGHCVNLSPTLDDIAAEMDGKVKVGKINVDEQPELAAQYGVMTIPTVLLFRDGEISGKTVGALPKPALLSKLGL